MLTDNSLPDFTVAPSADSLRADLRRISAWVKSESRVLDLGCGGGSLLHHLRDYRQVRGWGIENNGTKISHCIQRGVNVIEANLDSPETLIQFDDGGFDYAVMSLALQAVEKPDVLLLELLRIGKEGIVTFPNFGHWRCRWQIANGRMPQTGSLPEVWYKTDNIHLCTVRDFEALCADLDVEILERTMMDRHLNQSWRANAFPNFFSEIAQYRLRKR